MTTADDLRVAPGEVGFSAERLARIDDFYRERCERGETSGVVTLIARHGRIAHFGAVGDADVASGRPVATDTLFRLFSMTKPIVATALMMLYEEGRFQLGDPVGRHLPELADLRVLRHPDADLDDTVPAERPPTIQDLLRHTAGFTHCAEDAPFDRRARVALEAESLADLVSRLAELPLRYQPGSAWVYSIAPDVQARLVEVLSGMPFEEFLRTRLFEPLGMVDTGYGVSPDRVDRLAVYYGHQDGGLIPAETWRDRPASVLFEPWVIHNPTASSPRINGSIGLVGTAEDYWRFCQMLVNGGELDGVRILSPRTIAYMTRDHSADYDITLPWRGVGFGLGFGTIVDPTALGIIDSVGTYFFQGMAGTVFWIDPSEDLVVVGMVQCNGPVSLWDTLRPLVAAALVGP